VTATRAAAPKKRPPQNRRPKGERNISKPDSAPPPGGFKAQAADSLPNTNFKKAPAAPAPAAKPSGKVYKIQVEHPYVSYVMVLTSILVSDIYPAVQKKIPEVDSTWALYECQNGKSNSIDRS
jgi:hypothetical protein